MKFVRPLGRLLALAAIALLWLPALALVPAGLFDRGPDGRASVSLFPAALALWDPFVWDCAWNSLAVASIVTLLSLLIGTALASVTGTRRFWGRGPLRALAFSSLAIGPFLGAFGFRMIADRAELVGWLVRKSGRFLVLGITWETWLGWTTLIVVGVLTGAVVVALAAESALARVDPAWIEAGRALGASRRRAWRDLAWPNVRPSVARGAASVFLLTLFEPGAPILLGLPRTLAYGVVEAATRSDELPRAAVLTLIGLVLGLAGRAGLRWWGGTAGLPGREDAATTRSASWAWAASGALALAVWGALALSPLVGICLALRGGGTFAEATTYLLSLLYYSLLDRNFLQILSASAVIGLAVAMFDGLLTWTLITNGGRLSGRIAARMTRPLESIPALALGVGALAIGEIIPIPTGRPPIAWLDPTRTPGILLILALAGARLPGLMRQAASRRDLARPELVEVSLAFGASRFKARRMARGSGSALRSLALVAAISATSLSPAILLTPTSDLRPIGPSLIDRLDDPPVAASLALVAILINAAGFALAADRSAPAGHWYRGPIVSGIWRSNAS